MLSDAAGRHSLGAGKKILYNGGGYPGAQQAGGRTEGRADHFAGKKSGKLKKRNISLLFVFFVVQYPVYCIQSAKANRGRDNEITSDGQNQPGS